MIYAFGLNLIDLKSACGCSQALLYFALFFFRSLLSCEYDLAFCLT